ncbi:MAG TPA: phosphoenolpyruvate-utilizing N-terminal domain-containing protein, partial [Longimicrobiaceae bacterium]|nr:phosphoenolpyruvate-utilizing N-terminal domain-containing protein [Longimicrobiaceae bacterium]
MSLVRDGIPASPGIVIAPARVLRWEVPRVPHGGVVPADQVEHEVERFREAREWAKERIRELQARTETNMGRVEAQIFEPQILMLEDSDLIEGTISYIRENHLTAERAFEWRVLEWESQWSHTAHPMVLDKLNDLADVQNRVLRRLLGMADPELRPRSGDDKVILVAHDLTPSLT